MGKGRQRSDYEQGLPGNATAGGRDGSMAPQNQTLNNLIDPISSIFGFDTSRRTGADDNDFYRDNAQYMPGYDINGIPSGAWAQDRATNHVGHGKGEDNPWDRVRRGLVEKESAMIDNSLDNGGDGSLGFGDVYDAHVEAYSESGGGGNQFIDPISFGMAMYGAPLLEAIGVDSGSFTGASIDSLNNPEDSAFDGWAKRMAMGGTMMGAGMAMGPLGLPVMAAAGAGMLWNTATAIGGADVANFMSDTVQGGLNVIGDGADYVGNLIGSGISAVGSLFSW